MRNAAIGYGPVRGSLVVSRQSGSPVQLAGLQRAQRFAGEVFGHEEHSALPPLRSAHPQRWLWWLAIGIVAAAGLGYLHFL